MLLCRQVPVTSADICHLSIEVLTVTVRQCRELETLQDRVPPRPVADITTVLEQELGMPVSQAYAEFEEDAKAAASLAQVLPPSCALPGP